LFNFTLLYFCFRFRSENTNIRDLLAHRTCLQPDFWGLLVAKPYEDKYEWL